MKRKHLGMGIILIALSTLGGLTIGMLMVPKAGYVCYTHETIVRLTPLPEQWELQVNGTDAHPTLFIVTTDSLLAYPLVLGVWNLRQETPLFFETEDPQYNVTLKITQITQIGILLGVQLSEEEWGSVRSGIPVRFSWQIWEWKPVKEALHDHGAPL